MPEEQTVVHIHRDEGKYLDSIEIGTPSKGGAVKVYFDASKPEEAEVRLKNAMALRSKAQGMVDAV